MKYALIGCGRIAVNHLNAAVANGLEIVAVCDRDPRQIDALFEKTSFACRPDRYEDHAAMLAAHPEIDVAAVATDSGSHARIALDCICTGVHTIVEKPIALSMGDADAIVRASAERGVLVAVCHQNRFNEAIRILREAREKGRFGKLSHGSVCVRWNRNENYYRQASWRGKWATDGGALMNQCIHGIDLLLWMMMDRPVEVYGCTARRFHDYIECEDLGAAIVRFEGGAVATIEGTVNVFPRNLEETLTLFGETGTARIGGTSCNTVDVWDFADPLPEDASYARTREIAPNVYGNGHTALYADMIRSVLTGKKPYVDAEAGRSALEIILAIYKSRLTGLPVPLPLTDFSSEDMTGLFR